MAFRVFQGKRIPLTPEEIAEKAADDLAQQTLEPERQLESLTDGLILHDAKFRVLAELCFEILKASNTGNFSEFAGVTNKATFRAYLKEKLRTITA